MKQTKEKNLRSLLRTPNSEPRTEHLKKVLLIFPRDKGIKFSNDTLYPFPMLGLTLLGAYFSASYEVKIINEAIEEIDFDADVDLVGITALTCVAKRAYEIADRFRERGGKIIL